MKFGPYKKLGTHWWFELFDCPKDTEDIEKLLLAEMDRFESAYSRFLPDSLVSQLNKERELINPPTEFLELLNIGLGGYKNTKGVFNITVGGVLESHGYDSKYSFKKQETVIGLSNPMETIHIKEQDDFKTIHVTGDTRIDFGGFGKGYLIDRLAVILKEKGVQYFLINGGGDMYATSDHEAAIEIILQNPQERDTAMGKLSIKNEAFAASSPYIRQWTSNGSTHTHLVAHADKSPGSVFVLAPTATDADMWATTIAIDPHLEVPHDITYKVL